MKKIILVVLITLILSGCVTDTVTGTYTGQNPSNITLYSDGTFVSDFQDGKDYSLSGTYVIQDGEIVIKYDFMGITYRLQRESKALVYEGARWVKQ